MSKRDSKAARVPKGTGRRGFCSIGMPARFHRRRTDIRIVPHGQPAKAPDFLAEHYRWIRDRRSRAALIWDTALRAGMIVWLPFRTLQVGIMDRRSLHWMARTVVYSAHNFVDPLEVSLFGLMMGAGSQYMRRFELASVMRLINPAGWRPACPLNDKSLFQKHCAERALPAPVWRATIWEGDVQRAEDEPRGDLIIKPVFGRGGKGVRLATFDGGRFHLRGQARPFSFEALLDHLSARRGALLIQDRICSHPALRDLAPSALPTARLTTCINEAGESELVTAYFRMAAGRDVIVDNISAGGLIAPIDFATGRLGKAISGKRARQWLAHPLTGAAVEGRLLPDWVAAVAMAKAAHATLARYTCIAWDVALTPDGPCIVEGNSKPCIISQRATGLGFGRQRFGELIEFHLGQAVARQANN